MNLDTLQFSQHAKQRYAERIMNKQDQTEVAIFLFEQDDKIKNDIRKMIEYGELIYSGKPTSDIFNKQLVDIYLNGTWVIIVDPNKNNVITLYSIDLGLGKDFNDEYIEKLKEKLDQAKQKFAESQESVNIEKETYKSLILDNDAAIADYKSIIKSLQEQNQAYQEVIDTLDTNTQLSEKTVRDIVAIMIGKKIF